MEIDGKVISNSKSGWGNEFATEEPWPGQYQLSHGAWVTGIRKAQPLVVYNVRAIIHCLVG